MIITGPNGAETTTFVRSFLPAVGIRDLAIADLSGWSCQRRRTLRRTRSGCGGATRPHRSGPALRPRHLLGPIAGLG
ncbi:hypothetical protein, partial [Endobacter medicaginis]|uniref:hypothetical protein n=1 Tax=Endobacter medicaginis TaxID=1181271 RepID=UPI001C4003F4